jgi:hypothetical protein
VLVVPTVEGLGHTILNCNKIDKKNARQVVLSVARGMRLALGGGYGADW